VTSTATSTSVRTLSRSGRWWFALGCGALTSLLAILSLPTTSWWLLCPLVPVPLMWLAWRWEGRARTLLVMTWLGSLPLWAYQQWWTLSVTQLGFYPFVMLQALWPMLYVWLLWRVRVRAPRVPLEPMAAFLWVAVEVFRGEVFMGGYAWGYVGHPLIDSSLGVSLARLGGAPLASLACTTTAAAIVGTLSLRMHVRPVPSTGITARWPWIWTVLAFLGAIKLWATALFAGSPPPSTPWPIAVVQTNVSQDVKSEWTAEEEVRDYVRFQAMTMQAVNAPPDERPRLIVWPETMMPGPAIEENVLGVLRENQIYLPLKTPLPEFGLTQAKIPADDFAKSVRVLTQRTGVPMLVGEEAFENFRTTPTGKDNEVEFQYDKRFNSVYLIQNGDVDPSRYDKIAITPFGEFMPVIQHWPWLVQQLRDFAAEGMRFDLARGTRRTVFDLPRASKDGRGGGEVVRCVTPICFEVTVADMCRRLVFDGRNRRADLLVNVTNDGWFGMSKVARLQHLQIARWRCAELGTPMVRAANTGLSAIIDARGQVVAQGVDGNPDAVNVAGILSGDVPLEPALAKPPLFVRVGWISTWLMLIPGAFAVIIAAWPRRRSS
jgi:apolipoprotein N-acyltransferase